MSTGKRKTAEEKVAILKEAETLGAVETIRKHGISYQTYYTWKAKHASDIQTHRSAPTYTRSAT